jgi:hypothetical protein
VLLVYFKTFLIFLTPLSLEVINILASSLSFFSVSRSISIQLLFVICFNFSFRYCVNMKFLDVEYCGDGFDRQVQVFVHLDQHFIFCFKLRLYFWQGPKWRLICLSNRKRTQADTRNYKQTPRKFFIAYAFFRVIPRRLNFICRLFRKPSVQSSYLSAYEDGTECSETSTYKIQTPGNYPEESIQHSEHGESLKSKILHFIWHTFLKPRVSK